MLIDVVNDGVTLCLDLVCHVRQTSLTDRGVDHPAGVILGAESDERILTMRVGQPLVQPNWSSFTRAEKTV